MAQDNGPIEIVLDVRRFQDVRVRKAGGGAKEFFDGDDAGFVAHRGKIQQSLSSVAQKLQASSAGRVGFVRVRMREQALAKSHRPVASLFQPTFAPTIGSSGVGEIIVQVTPFTIERALAEAAKAEDRVGYKPHKTKPGVMVPDPSRARSEVGAIESLSLWSPADRRGFDAAAAVNWFETRAVPRAYRVDLFDSQRPAQRQAETDFESAGDLVADLQRQIDEELDCGYVATLFRPDAKSMTRMYIWLVADPSIRHMVTPNHLSRVLQKAAETTLDIKAHKALLATLEVHPAVRRISLPPNLRRDATSASAAREPVRGRRHQFVKPLDGAQYPVVGVIDGGLTQVPSEWIVHATDYLSPSHADKSHGTEIGSLLVAGQALNGDIICPEPDGCWLADLALIPREDAYDLYYKSELDLVSQIEQEVQEAKVAAQARVFSFSHNFDEPPGGIPTYTDLSQGLDRIARENNVIFVVSAGNAGGPKGRREWTNNQVAVLSNLASCSGDRITAPADSVLNVAVGAVNPPHISGAIAGAPARYSRRGPGFMQLVKPDVAHYGGVCESTSLQSGLQSISEGGSVKDVHGTSFSAPLVAKAIARYDQITLGALPREALIALLIHGAKVPDCLDGFNRSEVVRNLVGFGVPINAQQVIEGSPHAATLLFHDRMMPKKDLFFGFDWPRSLVTNGKCRGHAMLTLVYTPPISDAFESELVRVNFEASLQRRNPKTSKFEKQCTDTFSDGGATSSGAMEKELMEDGLKWGVVKQSQYFSARGAGASSDWRIALKYLLRAEELFPEDGVPFSMILTISDPDDAQPVYQDMKIGLSARDVLTGDIRQPSGRVQARGGRSSG
jgi:hypothetical protein